MNTTSIVVSAPCIHTNGSKQGNEPLYLHSGHARSFPDLSCWVKPGRKALSYIALLLLTASLATAAQEYTRGIGVYPGDPKEYTGPSLVVDAKAYRNLALHRPAYQSSAYDYNLTAQLVTDGIVERSLPQWIITSTSSAGTLKKQNREVFLDGNIASSIDVTGSDPWVEFDLEGGKEPPELDRIDLWLRRFHGPMPKEGWTYIVSGSEDHIKWTELGRATGAEWPDMTIPDPSFRQSILFGQPARSRYYRVQFRASGISTWAVAELTLFDKGQEVRVAGPNRFASAWMSAGSGEEWVYVDLGASCTFDRVKLWWLQRPAEGIIQVSSDTLDWKPIHVLTGIGSLSDDIQLTQPARGRYVRVLMSKPVKPNDNYILSEFEVFGRGGPVAVPALQLAPGSDGSLDLAGGRWRVQRASLVKASGEQISEVGFQDRDWMIATVPGTVLTSYLNAGAIPNPDFGDNQYAISDSFFYCDFWYRDEFILSKAQQPEAHTWINFNGINWKAEVFLNGQRLGRIDGGFQSGHFDVTRIVHPGVPNSMAVRIIRNANPGSVKDKEVETVNGGALGLDNPTFHASAGWDWMPTIRDRNIGIWNGVSVTTTGPVTIEKPFVTSTLPLPDTTRADISIETTLHNQETQPISGVLQVRFGDVKIDVAIEINGGEAKTVLLTPATQPLLRLKNPRLWWPVGYGEPNLYPVVLTFSSGGRISDTTAFQAGIRQFKYSEDGGVLKMWINGRRFIARGGNWGFPESMLRYRRREYEVAMQYHRDLHLNMIRDWVGQVADEAFYATADRYGIVVWQDFWLANPWDGPNPNDDAMFLLNAKDYLLRIRNHASLGLFCGRNEGYPPRPIDDGLRSLVAALDPQSHYISSSADGSVSGHGPYRVEPLRYYFENAPEKLHSEMGSPNVVEMDSLRRTLPESAMIPQSSQWQLHDFYPRNPFGEAIQEQFGGATETSDWMNLAQFVDYNAYRGMFEGQSRNRFGLLIWMSHPAWPSLLWQTYDYFFDTDAGYFGTKKGAEPLHIQWNASTDEVEVVNYSAGNQPDLSAHAELMNLDGSVRWDKSATIDSTEDSTVSAFKMDYPVGLSRTHFIRLTLSRGNSLLSSNFYLRGLVENDYAGIRNLPRANVVAKTHIRRKDSQWLLETELHNVSAVPALMVRIKAVRRKTGDLILPALYDDNYIALMPGERKTIHVALENVDTRGERPRIIVLGYNVAAPIHK